MFTLLSHVLFLIIIGGMLISSEFRRRVYSFVHTYILSLLFTFSFAALVGSLAYSNIVGFPPCELCWIQRIFMYPQVILAGMAMYRKDVSMVLYLLPLSVLGGLIALYHSLSHYGLGDGILECTSALGDCGKLYVFEYGYITIPLMAFTIFIYLIAVSLIYFKSTKHDGR